MLLEVGEGAVSQVSPSCEASQMAPGLVQRKGVPIQAEQLAVGCTGLEDPGGMAARPKGPVNMKAPRGHLQRGGCAGPRAGRLGLQRPQSAGGPGPGHPSMNFEKHQL